MKERFSCYVNALVFYILCLTVLCIFLYDIVFSIDGLHLFWNNCQK